jgi:hypothetical protein
MILNNVISISSSEHITTFFELLKSLGAAAGIIALVLTVKNSIPQIKVTVRESWYYNETSKNQNDTSARIIVVSIANQGKVPIKIESSGFVLYMAESKLMIPDTQYPSKTLISGERYDRYHDSNELAERLSKDLGIILHFGNIVKMKAFCEDQTGKSYESKTFTFDIELKENTLPRLFVLGAEIGSIHTFRKGAIFYRSLYRMHQRCDELLGKNKFKSRMEYALSKQKSGKTKKT